MEKGTKNNTEEYSGFACHTGLGNLILDVEPLLSQIKFFGVELNDETRIEYRRESPYRWYFAQELIGSGSISAHILFLASHFFFGLRCVFTFGSTGGGSHPTRASVLFKWRSNAPRQPSQF
jgi:hypothetical protein